MTTHLMPRFAEPPRQSDAETARWAEVARLRERRTELRALVYKLLLGYPKYAEPPAIGNAVDELERGCDWVTRRIDELEDGPDA